MTSLAAAVVALCSAVSPSESSGSSRVEATQQVRRPGGVLRGSLGTGFPDLVTISTTFLPPRTPLELEVGGGVSYVTIGAFARGGLRHWFVDTRAPSTRGVGVAGSLLAGPRFFQDSGRAMFMPKTPGMIAASAVAALDVWLWPPPQTTRAGLVMQFAVGAFSPVHFLQPNRGSFEGAVVPEARLSLGVGF